MLVPKLTKKQKSIIQAGVLISIFLLLEKLSPLRKSREQKSRRIIRNLAIAGLGLLVQAIEKPLIDRSLKFTKKHNLGLLNLRKMPNFLRLSLGVILLDYTLYWWHYLNHKSNLLWRFHEIHHADLDMDFSTANRFHFGELALSVFWRLAQIHLLGISSLSLNIWQQLLSLSILFHHANLRLPWRCEQVLQRFIVTPQIHALHHSINEEQANTNFSSGLSLWDRLHGTFRQPVYNESLTMGVPVTPNTDDVNLNKMLVRPFRSIL